MHKSSCKQIALHRANIERNELNLKTNPDIINVHGDIFTEHVGNFWRLEVARDYMQSRWNYVLQVAVPYYGQYGYYLAINELQDCLRLSRAPNHGLRNMLMLYLVAADRDQESYDFIKWYETVPAVDKNYNWVNLELPYLNVRFYDIFEPTLPCVKTNVPGESTFSKTCLLLIKIRILHQLHIRNAFVSFMSASISPLSPVYRLRGQSSIFNMIYEYLPDQHLLPKKDFFFVEHGRGGLPATLLEAKKQVREHLNAVKISNKTILQAIANPGPLLAQKSTPYAAPGTVCEAYLITCNIMFILYENLYISTVVEEFLKGDLAYDPTRMEMEVKSFFSKFNKTN